MVRKLRLVSKFTMSQTEWQIITIYILPYVSKIEGNQKMKFGQLIEYNMTNIFLQKLCTRKNEEGRLVPDVFLFFWWTSART